MATFEETREIVVATLRTLSKEHVSDVAEESSRYVADMKTSRDNCRLCITAHGEHESYCPFAAAKDEPEPQAETTDDPAYPNGSTWRDRHGALWSVTAYGLMRTVETFAHSDLAPTLVARHFGPLTRVDATPEKPQAHPAGTRLRDTGGDVWTVGDDGRLRFTHGGGSCAFDDVNTSCWGPLTVVQDDPPAEAPAAGERLDAEDLRAMCAAFSRLTDRVAELEQRVPAGPLPAGMRLQDKEDDVWTVRRDGRLTHGAAACSLDDVAISYGPLTIVGYTPEEDQ